jgi:AcrR family transcriptional regulator
MLTEVASSVGLAKSNVLRYFETREEVYIHLLVAEWGEFKTMAKQRLLEAHGTPAAVAAALADSAAERPLFCDLRAKRLRCPNATSRGPRHGISNSRSSRK